MVDILSIPEPPAKAEAEKSPEGGALDWARQNIANPFVNSVAIDTWNGLSGTVADASGKSTNTAQLQRLEVGDTSSWLNWGTQTVSATAGMILKFAVAGKVAGAGMRKFGEVAELEGKAARFAASDNAAQFIGAVGLTAAEKPRDGETRVGNVAATAFGMGVFQGSAALTRSFTGPMQFATRFGTGSLAGGGQEVISAGLGGREIDATNVRNAMVTGGIMGVGIPKAMEVGTSLVTRVNLATGRGVHVDRYMDHAFPNAKSQSPELKALAETLTWTKVQDNAPVSAAHVESNRITLTAADRAPHRLAHELQALTSARQPVYENQYKAVAETLKTGAGDAEASRQFRAIRLNQELDQLRSEHAVAKQLGITDSAFNESTLRTTLGMREAYKGTTYDKVWMRDFDEFKRSGGTYRPSTEYGGTGAKDANLERALAEKAVRALQNTDEIAVFAGGAVRNEILGRPAKDYDIATSASPEKVAKTFKDMGVTVFPKGESFGVMAVVMEGKQFEIATLRRDGQYSDGRRPDSVQLGASLREDAARRDLTINAMFKDPVTGKIYDFFGGQRDIQNGVLRAVGDPSQRFAEDPLRMLRVARFSSTFGDFTVDPATSAAIRANAPSLARVSAERVRDELKGILSGEDPARGMRFVMGSGLMRQVMPEMLPMRGPRGRQDPLHHPEGTAWTHTMMVVDQLKGSSFERMMGGLMHDIGKPATQKIHETGKISNHGHDAVGAEMTEKIMRRLKFTGSEISAVSDAVRLHMQMHAVQQMGQAKLARLLERRDIMDLIAIQHADAVATGAPDRFQKSQREFLTAKLEEMKHAPSDSQKLGAVPLINGRTLIEMGYRPGQAFSLILESARTAQYEGAIGSATAAKRFVTENFGDFRGLTQSQQADLLRARETNKPTEP